MIKLLKKSLVIPTCLTLLTASSQAALVLEFREVGGTQVELSFSGSVNIGSFSAKSSLSGGSLSVLGSNGLNIEPGGSDNKFADQGHFFGVDLFGGNVISTSDIAGDESIGLVVISNFVRVGSGLVSAISSGGGRDVFQLSSGSGGVLNGKTQTFNTTLSTSGLDRFLGNGPQDLWRVTGTTGTANLIQFRVNGSSVPEPSSILMSGLGLLTLVTRRKRKA